MQKSLVWHSFATDKLESSDSFKLITLLIKILYSKLNSVQKLNSKFVALMIYVTQTRNCIKTSGIIIQNIQCISTQTKHNLVFFIQF